MGNQESNTEKVIIKFLLHEADTQEVQFLKEWLRESEENVKYFNEVNSAFQASLLNKFTHSRLEKAWEGLNNELREEKHKTKNKQFSLFSTWKMAAAIAFLAGVSFVIWKYVSVSDFSSKTLVQSSRVGKTKLILPDSSVVWLNSNSSLQYAESFGKENRNIVLQGEAFFDVRKSKHDFIVTAGQMNIRVKGTKFNVSAYNDEVKQRTTLEEGSVHFTLAGEQKFYDMKPGDQITLNIKSRELSVGKVDASNFSAWKEDRLKFDNTPLAEIVQKMESRFRVMIAIDQHLAKQERFTMTIENETLTEVLESIRLSSRLHYRILKNKIEIYK